MRITHLALKMLAAVVSSCRTFDEKKVGNLKYLILQAQSGKDFDWSEFRLGLPEKSRMYDYIDGFMRINEIDVILERDILHFFGGIDHLRFTLDQINVLHLWNKKGRFADKYLFAHMLVPLEITRKHPMLCGKYMVAGQEVYVRGLVAHPLSFADSYFDLEVGKEYLVHFATVVAPAPNNLICSWLRREHLKNEEFITAMKNISMIDYRKFWSLNKWTIDMLKECGF